MQNSSSTLLFDRDNLRQIFSDWRNKELLKKYGYKIPKDLINALIAQKSQGAEYVVGLPGTGKTTFALRQLGAKAIETKDDIINLLTMNFDNMVFVTCDVEDEIAQNASKITLLHTSSQRIKQQRKQRDEDIQEDISETAFGRQAGSVNKVTTDDSILISKLKTDYADKSDIVVYKSNNPDNRDEKKEICVNRLSDKKKYIEGGVVAASGKRTPAQIVHIEHQLKKVLSLAQDNTLPSFAIITQNSGGQYDLGLTQNERIKIINLVLHNQLQFVTSGTPKFIKNAQGKVVKIIPEKSRAVLGKERLPKGFTEGTYDDIVRDYPNFLYGKTKKSDDEEATNDAYAVKAFEGYNFLNIGDIPMEGSEESISATFIRKCLVEGNINAIKPYLSPEIFSVLTSPHNLQALQTRYSLIQERDHQLKEKKDELIKKHKQINPLTGEPLLNKKGDLVVLSKKHADACKNRRDQAKIMTYLHTTDQLIKHAERKIKKKYNALIYSPENTLQF
ncbi:MAG: hypothetical protein NT085_02045 [candidate division SR1 bacterium]|nr:hypothetical protein [candidate division SR1 bacterium]